MIPWFNPLVLLTLYMSVQGETATGTAVMTMTWTDNDGVQQCVSQTLSFPGTANVAQSWVVPALTAHAVTVSLTVTPVTGTPNIFFCASAFNLTP